MLIFITVDIIKELESSKFDADDNAGNDTL
jgi:hypothetical protein